MCNTSLHYIGWRRERKFYKIQLSWGGELYGYELSYRTTMDFEWRCVCKKYVWQCGIGTKKDRSFILGNMKVSPSMTLKHKATLSSGMEASG